MPSRLAAEARSVAERQTTGQLALYRAKSRADKERKLALTRRAWRDRAVGAPLALLVLLVLLGVVAYLGRPIAIRDIKRMSANEEAPGCTTPDVRALVAVRPVAIGSVIGLALLLVMAATSWVFAGALAVLVLLAVLRTGEHA